MRKNSDFIKKDVLIAIAVLLILPLALSFRALDYLGAIGAWVMFVALVIVWLDRWEYTGKMRQFLQLARWFAMYALIINVVTVIALLVASMENVISPLPATFSLFSSVVYLMYYRMMLQWSATFETNSKLDGKSYRRDIVFFIALPFLALPIAGILYKIDPTIIEQTEMFKNQSPVEWLWSNFVQ